MSYTWGALALNVTNDSGKDTRVHLEETDILSDPAASGPASVLMGGGRGRTRRTFQGWAVQADYDSLYADYLAQTERTLTCGDETPYTAIIEAIPATRERRTLLWRYTLTLVEA